MNECLNGQSNCSINALCENTQSSYTCTCNDGYDGDGVICTGTFSFLFLKNSKKKKKKKKNQQIKMNVRTIMEDVMNKQHVLTQRAVLHVNVIMDIPEMVSIVMVL